MSETNVNLINDKVDEYDLMFCIIYLHATFDNIKYSNPKINVINEIITKLKTKEKYKNLILITKGVQSGGGTGCSARHHRRTTRFHRLQPSRELRPPGWTLFSHCPNGQASP